MPPVKPQWPVQGVRKSKETNKAKTTDFVVLFFLIFKFPFRLLNAAVLVGHCQLNFFRQIQFRA